MARPTRRIRHLTYRLAVCRRATRHPRAEANRELLLAPASLASRAAGYTMLMHWGFPDCTQVRAGAAGVAGPLGRWPLAAGAGKAGQRQWAKRFTVSRDTHAHQRHQMGHNSPTPVRAVRCFVVHLNLHMRTARASPPHVAALEHAVCSLKFVVLSLSLSRHQTLVQVMSNSLRRGGVSPGGSGRATPGLNGSSGSSGVMGNPLIAGMKKALEAASSRGRLHSIKQVATGSLRKCWSHVCTHTWTSRPASTWAHVRAALKAMFTP